MNTPDEILTVLVLFEMNLEDSPAYQSLSRALEAEDKKSQLFVYDNSAEGQKLHASPSWRVHYQHDPTNPGVSRAYNQAAVHARKLQMKWILFADQDTSFPQNIFKQYQQYADAYPACRVLAPQLVDSVGLVSPFQPGLTSGKRMNKIIPGKKSLHTIQAINSGLMVDLTTFESTGGYEERLPLDFSDFNFFRRLKLCAQHIVITDAECKHEHSSTQNINLRNAASRFKIYLQGSRVMGREESGLLFFFRAFFRALKLSFRYRSFRFIGQFLSSTP